MKSPGGSEGVWGPSCFWSVLLFSNLPSWRFQGSRLTVYFNNFKELERFSMVEPSVGTVDLVHWSIVPPWLLHTGTLLG